MQGHTERGLAYYIDLDWYKRNSRSFSVLAEPYLCSQCQERLNAEEGYPSESALIKQIASCCSRRDDYIRAKLPLLESIFRILIANGNKPLSIEEIRRRLEEKREGNFTPTVDTLHRLLENDYFYGLQPVSPEPGD